MTPLPPHTDPVRGTPPFRDQHSLSSRNVQNQTRLTRCLSMSLTAAAVYLVPLEVYFPPGIGFRDIVVHGDFADVEAKAEHGFLLFIAKR